MVDHLEILVEEPSAEAFLRAFLPRVLTRISFEIYPFQGKSDLLANLDARLRGYAAWLPANYAIVVLVDRDDDDCIALKKRLERACASARLISRSVSPTGYRVANRIAIEELEAWFVGDWAALQAAYPKLANQGITSAFRDPDAIRGGTWEALERLLKGRGYFKTGLRKMELARTVAPFLDPQSNRSASFRSFVEVLRELDGSVANQSVHANRSA